MGNTYGVEGVGYYGHMFEGACTQSMVCMVYLRKMHVLLGM